MKAVIQRVLSASVSVDSKIVSSIERGLCCLIGIGSDDSTVDIEYLATKISNLRLFPEDHRGEESSQSAWKRSVKDVAGEILCVSQFTLLAATRKGNKPDFHAAMRPDQSKAMYESLLDRLGVLYEPQRVKDGVFGAMMQVSLVNDGPVTIILDSKDTRSFNTAPLSSKDDRHNELLDAKVSRRQEAESRTARNAEEQSKESGNE